MSALTKQRDEDGGYSKRAKELFFKDEDDDTTSEIKVIEDCKTFVCVISWRNCHILDID